MNTKLLRKVQRHILAEPKRLDMSSWAHEWIGYSSPACGTVACIAGWGELLSHQSKLPLPKLAERLAKTAEATGEPWRVWIKRGRRRFGLTPVQASRLFFSKRWPERFQRPFWEANSFAQSARVTAKRIDHFIKTKGEE